jgi:hypothetical protein
MGCHLQMLVQTLVSASVEAEPTEASGEVARAAELMLMDVCYRIERTSTSSDGSGGFALDPVAKFSLPEKDCASSALAALAPDR